MNNLNSVPEELHNLDAKSSSPVPLTSCSQPSTSSFISHHHPKPTPPFTYISDSDEEDLYYHSSDLNMESSDDNNNSAKKLIKDSVNKRLNFDNSMIDSPGKSDLFSPILSDSDPLGHIKYPDDDPSPVILVNSGVAGDHEGVSSAPSSVKLPKKDLTQMKPPDRDSGYFTQFTRSNRSIRPRKRRHLVRSSSLDKKYFTTSNDLYSASLESFGSTEDQFCVVQSISPSSPISINSREFLSPCIGPGM
eukprot:sb/3468828/